MSMLNSLINAYDNGIPLSDCDIPEYYNETPSTPTPIQRNICQRFVTFEVPGYYHDIVVRPMQTNINDKGIIERFLEQTNDGTNVNNASLLNVSNEIISPSTAPVADVCLSGGNQQRRLIFMMTVKQKLQGSKRDTEVIISGWSDPFDSSYGGHIDPNLRFYINSITTVGVIAPSVVDSYHLFNGNTQDCINPRDSSLIHPTTNMAQDYSYNNNNKNLSSIRPCDVVRHMGYIGSSVYNIDTTNSIGLGSNIQSRRSNGIGSRFLATTAGSVLSHKLQHSSSSNFVGTHNGLIGDCYSNAGNYCREPSITTTSVITTLSRNVPSLIDSGFITYRDLCGNIENVVPTHYSTNTKLSNVTPIHMDNTFTDINSTSFESLAATTIISYCLSLMASEFMLYLNCNVTNEVTEQLGGSHLEYGKVFHTRSQPFTIGWYDTKLGSRAKREKIRWALVNELLPLVSKNNQVDVSFSIEIDLMVDSRITVSAGGSRPQTFVMPSFCDSLYSSVIATDNQQVNTVARDVKSLVDAVNF